MGSPLSLRRHILLLLIVLAPSHMAQSADSSVVLWDLPGRGLEWILASPDGSSVAFALRADAGITVYRDKTNLGSYEHAFNPFFSANARSFAFLAIDTNGATFVVNGRPLPQLRVAADQLANPQMLAAILLPAVAFNPDGTIFAYRSVADPGSPIGPAPPGMFEAAPSAIYLNGKAETSHPEVGNPVYNPSTNELLYRVRDNGLNQAYLNRGGVQGKKYAALTDPVVSADGLHVGYSAETEAGKWFPVVDGVESGSGYDFPSSLVFSPNGKRVAFIAGTPGVGQFVVVDGRRDPQSFKYIGSVQFSQDNARYGYVGNSNVAFGVPEPNETVIIVDGKEVARQPSAVALGPFLGPATRTAYILMSGARATMVLDGRSDGPYGSIGFPVYSPAGDHVAYGVVDGLSGQLKMIVDGVSSSPYSMLTPPRFTPANTAEYYAATVDDRVRIVRITHTF